MKEYLVKVTEMHTDKVWVTASNQEEAKDIAISEAQCDYELVYDCVILSEEEI